MGKSSTANDGAAITDEDNDAGGAAPDTLEGITAPDVAAPDASAVARARNFLRADARSPGEEGPPESSTVSESRDARLVLFFRSRDGNL
mmetsp:Transcript_11001/g.21790  ORF Transcript_11001/g.21790 Transcript_11001/m.21790 type:complete len:89 (+) Transcript_11001:1024-1290(+)